MLGCNVNKGSCKAASPVVRRWTLFWRSRSVCHLGDGQLRRWKLAMLLRTILPAARSLASPFPGTCRGLSRSLSTWIGTTNPKHTKKCCEHSEHFLVPFKKEKDIKVFTTPTQNLDPPTYMPASPPKCMSRFKIPQHTSAKPTAKSKMSDRDLRWDIMRSHRSFFNPFCWGAQSTATGYPGRCRIHHGQGSRTETCTCPEACPPTDFSVAIFLFLCLGCLKLPKKKYALVFSPGSHWGQELLQCTLEGLPALLRHSRYLQKSRFPLWFSVPKKKEQLQLYSFADSKALF